MMVCVFTGSTSCRVRWRGGRSVRGREKTVRKTIIIIILNYVGIQEYEVQKYTGLSYFLSLSARSCTMT